MLIENTNIHIIKRSVQISSVAQSCPTPCDPVNHSTPGVPVHHQLPEFTQTHVHLVSDAIQPSHPLLSPSPPAPNPSQHQGLFQWVNSSPKYWSSASASVLPMNTQDWCPLRWTGWISLQSKGLSRLSSKFDHRRKFLQFKERLKNKLWDYFIHDMVIIMFSKYLKIIRRYIN